MYSTKLLVIILLFVELNVSIADFNFSGTTTFNDWDDAGKYVFCFSFNNSKLKKYMMMGVHLVYRKYGMMELYLMKYLTFTIFSKNN